MGNMHLERRKHKRTDVKCPATLLWREGRHQAKGRVINLSDGGAMVSVPLNSMARVNERVQIQLAIPRETTNSRMVEEFTAAGHIVRQQPMIDEDEAGLAIRFRKPQTLNIEL